MADRKKQLTPPAPVHIACLSEPASAGRPSKRTTLSLSRETPEITLRMLVAILSPDPKEITPAIEATGDVWRPFAKIEEIDDADFVISYGYRLIIREPHISRFHGRLLNLHISLLPWNRGADPNFWSLIEGTPKGVSIHLVDQGLDTGPIFIQREVDISGTLSTSYHQLRAAMTNLFANAWPRIRLGELCPVPQLKNSGSFHNSADKEYLWRQLPLGFRTPIEEVKALGLRYRA